MKRFRAWLRRNRWRGGSRVLALIAALVALDAASKAILTTPAWAIHRSPGSWVVIIAVLVLILTALLGTRAAVPAALILAAALGNGGWEIATGSVPNPFVIQSGASSMAFNLADLYLMAGVALVAIMFIRFVPRSRQRTFGRAAA